MKSKIKNMDKFLFLLMLVYTILGLIMVFSASSMTAVLQYGYSESHFFVRQLFFVVVAYIVGFFILFMPYKYINLGKNIYKIFAYIAVGILFFTIVSGEEINGVTSWLQIGPAQIQPSEFAKTLIILYLAFSFKNSRKLDSGYKFLMPFVLPVVCFFLIAGQPDFGTAIIFCLIVFFIFMSLPLRDEKYKKLKIISGCLALVAIILFVFSADILKETNIFNEEQISRFTYKNPCTRYTEKTGYQVCNGFIAMNNGGLFGVGLGNSTQKYSYLPEAFTDFIFPIIVEELGAIVSSIIIIGFVLMLLRIKKIAKNAETLYGSIIAIGTFAFIVSHLLINLLGILAIIPLTGVPLPFLSNGGSFNMNLIVLLFMTERVAIESKRARLKREIDSL